MIQKGREEVQEGRGDERIHETMIEVVARGGITINLHMIKDAMIKDAMQTKIDVKVDQTAMVEMKKTEVNRRISELNDFIRKFNKVFVQLMYI